MKKGYKSVINTMKKDIVVLYGKNVFNGIPFQTVSRKDFLKPLIKFISKINNHEDYNSFESYLKKILMYFKKYNLIKEGKGISKIINSSFNWKIKLLRIKEIID